MCEGAQEGRTLLWWASSKGHKEVVEALLQAGADASFCNSEGRSPLRAAVEEGHVEVVAVLLAHGANVDTPDKVRTLPVLPTTRPAGRVELVCHTVSGAHVAVTAGT